MNISLSVVLPVLGAALVAGAVPLAFPEEPAPGLSAQGAVDPTPLSVGPLPTGPELSPLREQVAADEVRAAQAAEQARAAEAERVRAEAAAAAERDRQQRASRSRSSGDPKSIARELLAARGQSGQFGCLDRLWTKESGWQVSARNPSSGAYGIPQSLPASKMASAGSDWRTSARTQIRWGLGYIADRYGSPCAAWSHSQSRNWY